MNKHIRSLGKYPIRFILSLSLTVLGLGCIGWATVNIWQQSHYVDDATLSRYAPATKALNKASAIEPPVALADSTTTLPPDKVLYPVYPTEYSNIGSLTMPALKQKLPIIEGTSDKALKKGVGHFVQSVLPGEQDNCVLSGHRDTSFRNIGKLKIDDQLIVQTSAGTFTYQVSGTRIVHADDKTVIVPTTKAVLTLTTCYPFNAIGDAPDRYIVSANLVKSTLTLKYKD